MAEGGTFYKEWQTLTKIWEKSVDMHTNGDKQAKEVLNKGRMKYIERIVGNKYK
jgi:hypothetical protein